MNRRSFLKSMTAAPVAMLAAPMAMNIGAAAPAPYLWSLTTDGPLVIEGPGEYAITPIGDRLLVECTLLGVGGRGGSA